MFYFYNDDIKKQFELRIWVAISQKFELIDILRKIAKQLQLPIDPSNQSNDFLNEIHGSLRDKRYLIVFDDVWTGELWTQIGEALPNKNNGSRVLITTRFFKVAKDADPTCEPYKLGFLSKELRIDLFLEKALPNHDPNKSTFNDLSDITDQFVQKCNALPLTLVVLGGLLSKKPRNYIAWSKVLQTMSWHDGKKCSEIIGTSYDDLPFALKSCFLYFAAFPEDHDIDAESLIRMWVAEGFIPQEDNITLEETAESYLEDLVQRSLVQVKSRSLDGSIEFCCLHDLLRDHAIQKSNENNFFLVYSHPDCDQQRLSRARRVAVHHPDCDKLVMSQNLRTLLCFHKKGMPNCSKQKLLKVVSCEDDQMDSIKLGMFEGLTQLRYLNLSGELSDKCGQGDMSWKRNLEKIIGTMKCIQTLNINLKVRGGIRNNFPNCAWHIKTLRHVMTGFCSSELPPSTELPNLQTLTKVTTNELWKIGLPHLPNLRTVWLEHESCPWMVVAAFLGTLKNLISLIVSGSFPKDILDMREFPFYQHLQSLKLYATNYWEFTPNEMAIDVIMLPPQLIHLEISDCHFQQDVMQVLENLNSLKVLVLHGVKTNRKMRCSANGFNQLEALSLKDLTLLEDWEIEEGAMPILRDIWISGCDKLCVPQGLQHLTNLQELNGDNDVLREYWYKVTCSQVESTKASQASRSYKRTQMEYIAPISDGMVDQLNKIRSQFDEAAEDCEAIQLRESDGLRRLNNNILRLPTGHMVDEMSIFGRDVGKMEVIDFLLSEKENSFSVISIVGKGGLGKTTIAQLVYKDLRDSWCFDLFGWVCVSKEFDVRRLIKATVESVTKINYGVSALSPLQEELAETVKGKTILLVLDDVWNENQSLWESFQVSFKEARMVRILVTTRNKKVADVMQSTACFSPTNLPEDSCWQLFQHYASSDIGHLVPTHLVDMGMEIMRKCGGVPLAVKLIASLLRHENEEVWREILESNLWESNPSNDIFPALQISYAHLPTHLQRCFLFCSMYPKYYLLEKTKLIELWISHGYIEFGGTKRTTEIGVEYYEELKERSLLDDFSNCISECWELQRRYFLDDSSGRFSECCKLHDIIHDLARYNSEKEHSLVEINQPNDIEKGYFLLEAHHLYVGGFMGYVNQTLLQNQQNLKGLRTLSMDLRGCSGDLEHQYCINNTKAMDLNLELSEYYEECSGEVTICNLIKFEALMVLELKAYNLTKIPDSISMLKHLVYLGIISPRLKVLPLSIGLLCNLQTLILDCFSLEYLPECIGNLANLQFLYIQSGAIKKLPKSLCSLGNLLRLVIRCDNLEEVPLDLKNLSKLYALTIRSNRIQALPNTIGCLTSLEELNLLSLGGSYDVLPDGKVDYVPHGSVNFPAIKTMAAWLRVGTLNWLKDMKDLEGKLSIGGLKNTSNLEDAQHANLISKSKLETLDLCWDPGYYMSPYDAKSELRLSLIPEACKGGIVCADDVVSFSLLECLQPHPNLKKLLVRWYPSATVPNWMRDPSSFRSIQEVLLECCANIQSLPFENFHSLKHLTIVACSSIRVLQLEQVSFQLEKLQIVSCGNLELITGLGDLDMLAALEIYSCQALKSLTMGGMQLVLSTETFGDSSSTETFGDSSHEKPHTGQQSIASLRRLEIENCYLLHFLPDGLIPPGPCYVCVRGCGCPDMQRNLTSAINEISCSSNLWRWR